MDKKLQIGILSFFALIVGGAIIMPTSKTTVNVDPIIQEFIPTVATNEEDPIPPDYVVKQTIKEVTAKRKARAAQEKPATSFESLLKCPLDLFRLPFKAFGL